LILEGLQTIAWGHAQCNALAFGPQKINLHERGKEFEPMAGQPTLGSTDLCFLTDTPPEQVMERLNARGVPIVDGPVTRSGAVGPIRSVYIRNLNGNLVEIAMTEPAGDRPLSAG
jgi:catechol 2,3-dioxygenase-like lactoylglutathione lyase family enzyme